MHVKGPYLNLKQAAEYCGYSPDTFRRKLRQYELPRYGPEGNRFAQSVLDAWMQSPRMTSGICGSPPLSIRDTNCP